MAAIDNLRLFSGSVISEQQAMKSSFKNLYQTASFLHLVVLPYFILASYFFAISPRAAQSIHDQADESTESDTPSPAPSQRRVRIGWAIAISLTFLFFVNGLYTFAETSKHIYLVPKYSLYKYQLDHHWLDHANALIAIGHQIPAIICVATLCMNIVIWCRYKYYIPFALTLTTVVGMGVLVAVWYDAFFFAANFFEYTLFLGYYFADRLLFYVPPGDVSNDAGLVTKEEVEVWSWRTLDRDVRVFG